MATRARPKAQRRATLSKDRVLRAAVSLADEHGLASLTMRKLAQRLGVEAMSLYYHVADKDQLLDGMVELVIVEINARAGAIDGTSAGVTSTGPGWKRAMRQRILSAREVLLRHPWAPGLIESRTTMSPSVLRYYDALAGLLREGGFSVDLAHHAMHALGSRALGFTQELFNEEDNADVGPEVTAIMLGQLAKEYPNISAIVMGASHDADSTLGWCDDQFEFEFGLDLILDGLDRLRDTGSG